jgi:hypothetical protein
MAGARVLVSLKEIMKITNAMILLCSCLGVCCMNDNVPNQTNLSSIISALPEEISGWTIGEEDRVYTQKDLFEYINGGAELYISYGVDKVFNRTFKRDGQPDIIVDIFDMESSSNAFGIFSHSRETVEEQFGQGSQYTEGFLHFWKGRYYISILSSPETEDSKTALFQLAGNIESSIVQEGKLPVLLGVLPVTGLIEESIRFFHHYIWLNSHYFIANDNILFIDENTDAVLARYREDGNTAILLLVKYASAGDANRARDSYIENYLPESSNAAVLEMADGSWTGCRVASTILVIVFGAPDESTVQSLLDTSIKNRDRAGPHSY